MELISTLQVKAKGRPHSFLPQCTERRVTWKESFLCQHLGGLEECI